MCKNVSSLTLRDRSKNSVSTNVNQREAGRWESKERVRDVEENRKKVKYVSYARLFRILKRNM